jgi:tetratricopeptide (TPR) repeat protein
LPEPSPSSVIPLTPDPPTIDTLLLRDFNLFLDVKTEPLPATIYLGEKRLGVSPLKQNVSVKPGDVYALYADFELRELNDIYRKKVEFRAKPDSDVVEFNIISEIGVLKIQKLPRRVDFYLEGYYDYDKLKANPVKITNIVYGKPIYLPYGHYLIEFRERTKIAGSDNDIIQTRYQREYNVSADNTVLELNVTDNDLQFFPAVIKSNPSHANVYYAGEKVGVTPYTGNLPLGTNQLKLSKEGFFDAVVDIDMSMNSIYETTITLQTSKIGELINKAGEQMRNQQVDDAIATLVDALKYGGSAREKAQTYLILGDAYFSKADYEQAIPYYEKAGTTSEFEILSGLGLARCYNMLKNYPEALQTIVGVLVNLTPQTPVEQRMEANNVFKKISPFKSVIYINTTPSGAVVFSNDKKIPGQTTPLILYDRDMGNYRLEIQKPGYETFQTKVNLKIAEFVIVNVELKPEQL